MSNTQTLVDQLSGLTILQVSELVTALEKHWNVSAAAPVAMAAAAAPVAAAAAKTEFAVVLLAAGDQKVAVIKVVREVTGLGLVEAKKLVDDAAAGTPTEIKAGVSQEVANKIKADLDAAGAKVEVK
jgi:large subunit ribosomal protein L7/L12